MCIYVYIYTYKLYRDMTVCKYIYIIYYIYMHCNSGALSEEKLRNTPTFLRATSEEGPDNSGFLLRNLI